MRLLTVSALTFGIASSLGACTDNVGPGEDAVPHDLWISDTGLVLKPGQTFTFTAKFQEHDEATSPIESVIDGRWWTDDDEVLVVTRESEGQVEAVAPGTGTVWVEMGARRDSATVTVLGADEGPTHRWKDVAAGTEGACALDEGGHAYCWGINFYGELGNGSRRQFTHTHRPVRVHTTRSFMEIGKGLSFACARTAAGEVWCWGLHRGSRLGHAQPELNFEFDPVRVDFPGTATALAVGRQHACALDEKQKTHCWGSNLGFQLGIEEDVSSTRNLGGRTVPVAFDGSFESLSTNGYHTCAITPERALYCWGTVPIGSNFASARLQTPTLVPTPTDPVDVQAANGNTCLLSEDGVVYCFGGNEAGQSGHPPDEGYDEPVRTSIELRFQSIALSGGQTCGLLPGGEAWCWGGGTGLDPELTTDCGLERAPFPCSPEPVAIPGGHRFHTISVSHAVCGITPAGELYCWGSNEWGQLGIGRPDIESTHIPQRVLDPL